MASITPLIRSSRAPGSSPLRDIGSIDPSVAPHAPRMLLLCLRCHAGFISPLPHGVPRRHQVTGIEYYLQSTWDLWVCKGGQGLSILDLDVKGDTDLLLWKKFDLYRNLHYGSGKRGHHSRQLAVLRCLWHHRSLTLPVWT